MVFFFSEQYPYYLLYGSSVSAQENVCPAVRSRVEPKIMGEIARTSADFVDVNDKVRKKKPPFTPLELNTISGNADANMCTPTGRKSSQ